MDRDRGLGRLPAADDRDGRFPLRRLLDDRRASTPPYRYWHTGGWWGDQGPTPTCVGYAWAHWLEDGPVTHDGPAPVLDPELIYREAQRVDEWPGERYDGTSVRAGAKVLQAHGLIESYWWATSIGEVTDALLRVGPLVVGVMWYEGMDEPDGHGVIRPTGRPLGGHAFKVDGYNRSTGYVRKKGSWGRGWGRRGFAYIHVSDLDRLLFGEDGEAVLAVERRP